MGRDQQRGNAIWAFAFSPTKINFLHLLFMIFGFSPSLFFFLFAPSSSLPLSLAWVSLSHLSWVQSPDFQVRSIEKRKEKSDVLMYVVSVCSCGFHFHLEFQMCESEGLVLLFQMINWTGAPYGMKMRSFILLGRRSVRVHSLPSRYRFVHFGLWKSHKS